MSDNKEEKNLTAADDSEEDEDYVPTAASDDEGDLATAPSSAAEALSKNPTLSQSKRKKVDDAFSELFGKPYQAPASERTKGNKKSKPKSKKAMKKKKRILSEIFGGSGLASKIIETSSAVTDHDMAIRSQRQEGALKQAAKTEVKEMKMFAGQMMEISRTVAGSGSGSGSGSGHQKGGETQSKPKPAGIDAVLSKINGPQKITTIDKTNVDWENFKDKTGMEEELKKKAEGKDAYLVKKDFLNRVDARKFEQEKTERERKRASAAATSK
eukprot:CAMPEP_0194106830 /NCGR_PEP_ID=MMETSP0150-20130528/6807_1 /TAXON_ID=122233 /ORGANISM="Chaetoceros debilis, Strain MM31A-1" /LENGTH=269 /DNA_ID=CAMNT_0038795083 /DNA_START=144 /DNA_END=953 /DNA_ORIENTATION=-